MFPGEGHVGGGAEVVSGIFADEIGRSASRIRQGVRCTSDQGHKQPVRAGQPVGAERRIQNGRGLLAQGEFIKTKVYFCDENLTILLKATRTTRSITWK